MQARSLLPYYRQNFTIESHNFGIHAVDRKDLKETLNELHVLIIAKELNLKQSQVMSAAVLIEEGATVPFISRYRKKATGSLDEVAVASIRDRLEQLALKIYEQFKGSRWLIHGCLKQEYI